MKKLFLAVIALFTFCFANANIRLAKIFGDSMVLQRGQAIPVWGYGDKNEKVTVVFNRQTKTVTTGNDGKWRVNLSPEKAGGPYRLIIKGKNSVTLNDILVGDVWVCSGQSNMEFHVSAVKNAAKEIEDANYPDIRHFTVVKDVGEKRKDDLTNESTWKAATPANVGDFTAVGYFFARELYKKLKIPIGLIHTSWGGTNVETWTSHEAFESSDEFKEMIKGMPSLNLDSIAAGRKQTALKKLQDLQGQLPDAAAVAAFKEPSFDDAKWPQMKVPGLWEQQGLDNFDGVVWFRKVVNISDADAGKAAELQLGMIDDNDETYINGTKAGSTTGYNVKRDYNIPVGILKAGRNVIAVRVEDTGGGGGLYGDSNDDKLIINNKPQSLAGNWSFQVESLQQGTSALSPNSYPSLLYNAMIHPLIPFAIKGAIWYQGESNADRAFEYRKAFPLMITDWRKHWGQGNFPFYFVQLASYNAGNGNSKAGSTWAELREAQTLTLSLPNTGMAVTTDIGEPNDIHPKNKQDVGKRLAAVALHNTYGMPIVYSGPQYQSMKTAGNKVMVLFKNTGSGLSSKDVSGNIQGFEVAGADKQFHAARAIVKGSYVQVSSDSVSNPVAVRYAWADDASNANFYNKEGFPAVPFRTDNWNTITMESKYKIGQ